ncbi:MAG: ABC transporter permease subunit [Chloroflexi bacterium]|nr:ABC transporter permease subunit [Chloroflexota bacterium]
MDAHLPADSRTIAILRTSILWRSAFSVLAAAGVAALWMGVLPALPLWQKLLVSLLLAAASVLSGLAAFDLRSRRHRGRLLSLVLDYLSFVVCFVTLLNTGEVFIGIDNLADVFGGGIPYLGLALGGYLLGTLGDRFSQSPRMEIRLQQVSRYLILAGVVLFLWKVNVLGGLMHFALKAAQPTGLVALAGTVLFALAIWGMWREGTANALQAKVHHEQLLSGWLFLSPNLLGFLVFFAGPLLLSFYFSFTNSDAFNPPDWIGLENYAKILNIRFVLLSSPDQLAREVVDITIFDEVGRLRIGNGGLLFAAADKFFWLALRNTLTYALFAVPLSVIPALFLANILNSRLPGMKFFRAVYFIPSIAAIVGISLVWQWLYNATIGYINYFITLGVEGINTLFQAGLIDPKIRWVSDERTALLSVIIIAAWQTMGFNTVLFLAGLQNIPGELYEAATVDGAGPWAKFRRITIPMLAPSTFYVVSTTTIQAMQVFEQVFILMNPAEGPNNSTITLVLYLYRSGFINFKQGYASAIAWVLFIVIFGLTLIQFQRQRRSSIYEA